MAKEVFRFAVGSSNNPQSWIWRFWVHKNEVYLGAKDALQVFKVSLHNSGIWRIAFVDDLERENPSTDRVIVKWNRPNEFDPGWTPSIAILISSINPSKKMIPRIINDSRIQWFNPPAEGEKFIFKILFARSEVDLKSILLPQDKIVHKIQKKNGEDVLIVLRAMPLEEYEIAKIKDVMEKTKIHMTPNASPDAVNGARALLVVSEDMPLAETQPTIFDIPLGKENLDIPMI